MSTAVARPGRRRWITLVAAAALLNILVGVPAAQALGEIVSFQFATTEALESGDPEIRLVLTDSSPPTAAPVEVTISVVGGSASPDDYTLDPDTVTFPAGSPTNTVLDVGLSFNDDNIYENTETIELALTVTSGGSGGSTTTHTTTITNDDVNPSISVEDAAIDEDSGAMVFTVRRDGLTDLDATAVVTATSGTAIIGSDFTAAPMGVSIPPGGDSKSTTYTVNVLPDAIHEADETLTVTLGPFGGGVVPGDTSATGTIQNDDAAPTLEIEDVSVIESAGVAEFTVTRIGETAFTAEVDVPLIQKPIDWGNLTELVDSLHRVRNAFEKQPLASLS